MERAKITEGGVAFLIFAGCYPKDPACIEQYRDLPRVSSIKDLSFRPKDHPKYQAWNCFPIFYSYVFHTGGICIIPVLQSNNVCILLAAPNILKHTNASFLTLFEQKNTSIKATKHVHLFFLDPPPPHPKKQSFQTKKTTIHHRSLMYFFTFPVLVYGLWSTLAKPQIQVFASLGGVASTRFCQTPS